MYKLLVVDDEKLIRKGLIAKLAHNNINFSWIGEASNGEEAITLIQSEKPDIVITDIRMPIMDGIQLIRWCRDSSLNTRFIILSGYAEFEYAEQALNMGVSAYILKPIEETDIVQAINKAMNEIESHNQAKENAKDVAELGKDKKKLLLERVLNQIFHTSRDFENDVLLRQTCLKEIAPNTSYMLAVLHIDSSSFYQSPFSYDDLLLIKFSIKNILEEVACDCYKIMVDNQRDINQIFILFYHVDQGRLKAACEVFARTAYSKIQTYLQISITIGVSGVVERLSNEIYKQSRFAFEQKLILGSNQVFFFKEAIGNTSITLPEYKMKLLHRCMEVSDLNGIRSILNDIFLSEEASDIAGIYIRLAYSEVIRSLLKVCSNYHLNNPKDSDFLSGEVIDYLEDSRQIIEYLYTMIADILTGKPTCGVDSKRIVENIKEFIRNNYTSEITVGELAKKYAINTDYLSVVFKQETGKNMIRYLTEIRVENACKLLKETKSGISDISYSVGYPDRQYFNRIFKKIMGMTPAEYRKMKGNPVKG